MRSAYVIKNKVKKKISKNYCTYITHAQHVGKQLWRRNGEENCEEVCDIINFYFSN